jgi:hypothetical protein
MSVLVDLPPPAPEIPPAVSRIRQLSRPLELLFALLFAVTAAGLVLAVAAALAYRGDLVQVRPGGLQIYFGTPPPLPPGWSTFASVPTVQRLAMAVSACLMIGPALAILWDLRGLFALYGRGVVLSVPDVGRLGRLSLWLIAYAVAPALGHVVVAASGFDDRGWLRFDSLQALGLGVVLFVIARVMAWGAEVRDDASRFV